MDEQFITQLSATALGGIVAAIAGVVTIVIAKRIDRKDRHRSELIDAFASWAEAFENLISINSNYCDLITLDRPNSAPPDLKKMHDAEILRVGIEAGHAGRRFDTARFRIVLLCTEERIVSKVAELTKATMMNMVGDKKANARQFLGRVPSLRQDLDEFLACLEKARAFK